MTAPTPTRPGYGFSFTASPPNRTSPTDTGVAYVATTATQGRTDKAVLCHNLSDVVANFGPRSSGSLLYDVADVAFRSGLQSFWVGRRVGPSATKATVTLGTTGTTIAVDSIGAGPSTLSVQVVAGAVVGSVALIITDTTTSRIVEQSPSFSTNADFAVWAQTKARTVSIRVLSALLPVAGPTLYPLVGGITDNSNVTDATLDADLARLFPPTLGVGQLLVPGVTTVAAHISMLNHCFLNNRFALMDGPDSSDSTVATTAVQALQVAINVIDIAETYGMMLAPWRIVPGATQSSSRVVPPSAIVAGLIAQSDSGGNPNLPAAGSGGIDAYSISSSQPEWTDAQRQQLNDGGVVVFHQIADGTQRLYGWRTCAITDGTDDRSASWVSAGAARLRMQITADLSQIAESFLFSQIDVQGKLMAAFNGAIVGVLQNYWATSALYGATPSEAFSVDTGPTVNTPDSISQYRLNANIGVKISPFAEMIYFSINKAALTAPTV
jgi:hypothetical protein